MSFLGHPQTALTHHGIAALIRRDDGGGVNLNAPNLNTANPLTQAMIQRYASLPPEKLQELAASLGGSPQGQIVQSLLRQKQVQPNAGSQATGSTQTQLPGGNANGGTVHRDAGGGTGISLSMASPWWTRQEARQADSTYLNGSTLGRADSIRTQAPSGSYVLPADVVAGLGEGNSLAGARVMQEILASGPHGTPEVPQTGGRNLPHAPAPRMLGEAKGGSVPDAGSGTPVDVMLSHGELVIAPHAVQRWGRGNIKRGHRLFDSFVLEQRRRNIAKLKSLPPPVRPK